MSISYLSKIIDEKIKKNGPINFYEYMQIWLYGAYFHGKFIPGCYTGNTLQIGDKNGKFFTNSVDFFTTPEYSFLFGNFLAKKIIQLWKSLDSPKSFAIVEMGAGNGTMAYDILIGLKYFLSPNDFKKFIYTIVEISPTLFKKQKEKLKDFHVQFIPSSAVSPSIRRQKKGIFISNELPDAFPVHVIRKKSNKELEELFINNEGSILFEELWKQPSRDTRNFLKKYKPNLRLNRPYCFNTDALKWIKNISKILGEGYIITIDYSKEKAPTPQTYSSELKKQQTKQGKDYLVRDNIGIIDITTGLDFEMLVKVGTKYGLKTIEYCSQTKFFKNLVLEKEIKELTKLYKSTNNDKRSKHGYVLDDLYSILIQKKI